MSVQYGGKTVYGATLGILMLETRFPRILGDLGNAGTFPFPVQYRVVRGASPDKVVRQDPMELVDDFIAAGQDLVASGCDGITTNCGFLALIQRRLAQELGVPVATSSLMQIPMVQAMLPPDKRVAVLTISEATLTPAHLKAAGVTDLSRVPIVGTAPDGEFTTRILGDHPEIDFEACRQDMLHAAARLMSDHQDVGAIVLECTNMTPYAADIRKVTGLPVYSIYTLANWFHQSLLPDAFALTLSDPRKG